MTDSKGSWTKNYGEVDADVPFFLSSHHEGEAMLQSPSTPKNLSTSTTPEPQALDPSSILPALPRPAKHHSSYIHGSLTHEASSSNSSPTTADTTPLANPNPDLSNGNFHPRSQRTTVSSIKSFASSPLNPAAPAAPSSFPSSPFNRSGSRASTHINRIASEECRALASHQPMNHSGSRGSMILYRCVDLTPEDVLLPPARSHLHRDSVLSVSGDSIVSLSADSKYPARTIASDRGLIAYAYDPSLDELGSASPADDDYLHDPDEKYPQQSGIFPGVSFRGVINIFALMSLIAALLCLFVVYPVIRFYHDDGRNVLITFNTRINKTGQAERMVANRRSQIYFTTPLPLVDSSTPHSAHILKTAQDISYGLVFSDEFTQNGRSFSADQDPVWEAANISDVYSPPQIHTEDGHLLVRLDTRDRHRHRSRRRCNESIQVRGLDRGGNKERYTDTCLSGILKMKAPLCLSRGGFVEVGLGKISSRLDSSMWSGKRGEAEKATEGESTARRLIYWPGSSASWSSLNQSETPNIPADVLPTLASNSDSGTSLALSIGVPIEPGSNYSVGERSRRMEVEVDYVRVYQPIRSSPTKGTVWDCAAVRNDVMLHLLEANLPRSCDLPIL